MNCAIKTARVIDVHAHVVLARTIGAAGVFGPYIGTNEDGSPYFQVGESYRLNGVRYVGSPFMEAELRLARMAERGIDYQVLSPNPLTYLHFIPAKDAARYCQVHNDALAEVVRAHPERLGGLAALPIQSPDAAAEELQRAVKELGLLGAAFGTDAPNPLDAPCMDRLYEKASALGVPLFIHPGPAGIDGPAGDPALKRFELDIIAGFAAQETLAIATLIFGGVLDRHPKLDICISHGGGATALLIGRMARAARLRHWSPAALRPDGAFEERARRLWLDVHVEHPAAIELLSSVVGRDHLVYGTNFAGWDEPTAGKPSNVEARHGNVPDFLAGNARQLLASRHNPITQLAV
ncbi:amidohydrolase [Variovorax sp. WS11]|uniref:amidohydrolase family protein n=1 Tax=Variovorax sp. WS11 TaxID=1105204 RepID=UPI000D0D1131|nr:amidohydrolase family protein [Variovorax sp. WS11]NDZ17732.1 amidohydrolase [Variovorax sp. WS11]PSL80464.1 amidohydrolase [Variovorax sp. WS11]